MACLDTYAISNVYLKTCIKQTIPVIQSGWYQLLFISGAFYDPCKIPSQRGGPLSNYDFTVQIKNTKTGQILLQKIKYTFTQYGLVVRGEKFFVQSTNENFEIRFCGTGDGDWAGAINKVLLYRIGSTSEGCTWIDHRSTFKPSFTLRCIQCEQGMNLNVMTGECITRVELCAEYVQGICKTCIPDHFLQDNRCYTKTIFCDLFDSVNVTCYKCATGYTMINNQCYQVVTCNDTQYKNEKGECVDGKALNCGFYQSPSGNCIDCLNGYKFDEFRNCSIKIQLLKCSQNTQTTKFVIINRKCVQTDINCLSNIQSGQCPVCNLGFYSYLGKCYPISTQQSINLTRN